MGHKVSVICQPGSKLPFASVIDDVPGKPVEQLLPAGFDIVHFWATPQPQPQFPYLVTIQGNGQAGEVFWPNTVFVSRDHARRHGWTEFVYNGLDLSAYPLERNKDDYILFLAKAKWRVKNLKGAIRIANRAGKELYVCGGHAPFWARGGTRSFGMVDGDEKLKLIQKASVFLFPIIWQEPFGIVNIEALACGTPVVATPRGALPEIIDDTCGILADNFDELVAAIELAQKIDPLACRERVAQKFSHYQMAESYLRCYEKVLQDGQLRPGQPRAAADANPQAKTYYAGFSHLPFVGDLL